MSSRRGYFSKAKARAGSPLGAPVRLGAETWSGERSPEVVRIPPEPQHSPALLAGGSLLLILLQLALIGAAVAVAARFLALFPSR